MAEPEDVDLIDRAFAGWEPGLAVPAVDTSAVRRVAARRRGRRRVWAGMATALALVAPSVAWWQLRPGPLVADKPRVQKTYLPGPLTAEELLAGPIDLPEWVSDPRGCGHTRVRLTSGADFRLNTLVLRQVLTAELDGDAQPETVALIGCLATKTGYTQVVVFERGSDGRPVAVAKVIESGREMQQVLGLRARPQGGLVVRGAVSGYQTSAPRFATFQYAWQGSALRRVDNGSDLDGGALKMAVEVDTLRLGPSRSGSRTGTLRVTVRNPGTETSGRFAVSILQAEGAKLSFSPATWVGSSYDELLMHEPLPPGGEATVDVQVTVAGEPGHTWNAQINQPEYPMVSIPQTIKVVY